jgi:hypothetical protein
MRRRLTIEYDPNAMYNSTFGSPRKFERLTALGMVLSSIVTAPFEKLGAERVQPQIDEALTVLNGDDVGMVVTDELISE